MTYNTAMEKVTIGLEIRKGDLSGLFGDLLFDERCNHGKVDALIDAYRPLSDLCEQVVLMPSLIAEEREAITAGDMETAKNIRDEIDELLNDMVRNELCQRWQALEDERKKGGFVY